MRSVRGAKPRGLAVCVVLGVALLASFATAGSPRAQLAGWRDGPVGGLLSDDDYRRFGQLHSDDERRAFIDRFWTALDADSAGKSKSYRETFEKRCAAVDARFGSHGRAGWKSDRGRVFLALGEPSSIQHEAGGIAALETELWSYADPSSAERPLRIVFYRCSDGGYWLEPPCSIERDPTSVAFDGERADFIRKLRDDGAVTTNGRLLTMLNGLLLPVPGGIPPQRRPDARFDVRPMSSVSPGPVSAAASGVHALDSATYFFRAKDGSILTLLSLELLASRNGVGAGRDAEVVYHGVASYEAKGRRGEPLAEPSTRTVALSPAPGNGHGAKPAFFGKVYLEAGRTYAMRYAVRDDASEEFYVKDALVGVPELSGGFVTSSIVPAEEFGPAGPDAGRVRIGSEEVVPKPGGVFRRSELLRLYLQVYDAAKDPVSSSSRVDVVFRFYRSVKGAWKRHAKPFSVRGATGASMGLALPIGDWAPGPYRVAVELHDRVVDARTSAEGWFSIAAD